MKQNDSLYIIQPSNLQHCAYRKTVPKETKVFKKIFHNFSQILAKKCLGLVRFSRVRVRMFSGGTRFFI